MNNQLRKPTLTAIVQSLDFRRNVQINRYLIVKRHVLILISVDVAATVINFFGPIHVLLSFHLSLFLLNCLVKCLLHLGQQGTDLRNVRRAILAMLNVVMSVIILSIPLPFIDALATMQPGLRTVGWSWIIGGLIMIASDFHGLRRSGID